MVLSQYLNPWPRPEGFFPQEWQFSQSEPGIWKNTSVLIHLADYPGANLYVNLVPWYDNENFSEFMSLVGRKTAIDVLDLDTRSTHLFYHYYNVTELDEDDYRKEIYGDLMPIYSSSNKPCRSRKDENLPDWMVCDVALNVSTGTKYACGLQQHFYGMDFAPEDFLSAWNMTETDILVKALGAQGIASAFKSTEGSDCETMFLILDENFELVEPNGTGHPFFILRVTPRIRNGKKKKCTTATLAKELAKMVSVLFGEAMRKRMVAFCTTLTGKSGWFGANDWYGQVEVWPFRYMTVIYHHGKTPCYDGNLLLSNPKDKPLQFK